MHYLILIFTNCFYVSADVEYLRLSQQKYADTKAKLKKLKIEMMHKNSCN